MPRGQMCGGQDGWAEAGLKRETMGQEIEGQTRVVQRVGWREGVGRVGVTRGVDGRTDDGSIVRSH